MPPRAKYTKEQIRDAAYEMVREEGFERLSARNLASRLGMSTAPIFTAFSGIDELQKEVKNKAWELYCHYIDEGIKLEIPFKGAGLMYIKFAKDEPNLFKMLFMNGNGEVPLTHYFPSGDKVNEPVVRENVKNSYGLNEEKAKKLYNHLSVYVHGIAVMEAHGNCVFTDEDISRMLSEVFKSLINGGVL